MKKAASAFLRMEICHADITRMIRWMRNPNVTKYLNEAPDVAQSLEQLVRSVPEPMYQYHLCRGISSWPVIRKTRAWAS